MGTNMVEKSGILSGTLATTIGSSSSRLINIAALSLASKRGFTPADYTYSQEPCPEGQTSATKGQRKA